MDVDILNDKVNHAKEENVLGIGIRIIKNQRQGFAYTTNLNKIDETIKQAINNSKLNQIDENISIIDSNKKYTKIDGLYDKQLENVDLQEFIDYSKTLIDLVKEKKCNPTAGGCGVGINKVNLVNSNGVDVSEESTSCGASVSVNVADNDVVSSAYYYDIRHDKNIDLELIFNITSEIMDIKNVSKNTLVGKSFITKEDIFIGVCPIGHKDGITKAIKNVVINNQKYEVISDDIDKLFIKIDENIKVKDRVDILNEESDVYEMLDFLHTNRYYLMSILNHNLTKKYINAEELRDNLL